MNKQHLRVSMNAVSSPGPAPGLAAYIARELEEAARPRQPPRHRRPGRQQRDAVGQGPDHLMTTSLGSREPFR
jgi:hypothetical protein